MDTTRICVFIPAYNEEASLAKVIGEVRRYVPEAHIVVINDASTDRTGALARELNAAVVDLPFNLGIGGAVQTGLLYAQREGYEVAVELDGDGQHDPSFVPALVRALREKRADMVIGSRFVENTEYRASIWRQFGIHVFSFLIRKVTGVYVYDSTSGFRVYSRRAIVFLSRRYPTDFPEPESIVMLLTRGFTIREVPVVMSQRQGGQSVVGKSDVSLKAAYFLVSNAIAIVLLGIKIKVFHERR